MSSSITCLMFHLFSRYAAFGLVKFLHRPPCYVSLFVLSSSYTISPSLFISFHLILFRLVSLRVMSPLFILSRLIPDPAYPFSIPSSSSSSSPFLSSLTFSTPFSSVLIWYHLSPVCFFIISIHCQRKPVTFQTSDCLNTAWDILDSTLFDLHWHAYCNPSDDVLIIASATRPVSGESRTWQVLSSSERKMNLHVRFSVWYAFRYSTTPCCSKDAQVNPGLLKVLWPNCEDVAKEIWKFLL